MEKKIKRRIIATNIIVVIVGLILAVILGYAIYSILSFPIKVNLDVAVG